MDINFHYFAVKVLAVKAGFSEEDSQLIASYSQFVDDYDIYRYLYFKEIPVYAQVLAIKLPFGWMFNPVTTGFNSFFDYARLSSESNQRKVLIPFHFIPQKALSATELPRKEYRVKPVKMNEASLLQDILSQALNSYRSAPSDRVSLIRIGVLLHILADTYAHQRFSGFWNWENHAYLMDAVDNVDGSNCTQHYAPDIYYYVPSIGHPNISTSADDSNVKFKIGQKNNKNDSYPYQDIYERSNTEEFLIAAREILDYLRSCKGNGKIDDLDWDNLAIKIKLGFLTKEKENSALCSWWTTIFKEDGIPFYYDKYGMGLAKEAYVDQEMNIGLEQLKSGEETLISQNKDDFFQFNMIAYEIRMKVDPASTKDLQMHNYQQDLNAKDYSL